MFFVAPGSPVISVKATENLVVNEPSRIVGIVPALPAGKTWRVEIRTPYSGGPRPLKELRVIKSEFTVTTN
ncbi:MAG: DUF4469 domain-containing protein [Spirochaetaceae bacterium]|nr:DUF4469 domain-containing protein [Spirochaetaceae bacterium]